MKIRVYILTYKNPPDLNGGLEYFFNSNAVRQNKHEIEIFVVNNHSDFQMHSFFEKYVRVLHNPLQCDLGTGHNSRNWNQMLTIGFQNLKNPACDLVITAHDDTWWGLDWLNLIEDAILNKGYTYIACGLGDNIQVWTPQAVRRIGLWDERFSVLAMAEHDYFYRAVWLNGDKSSINDEAHGHREGETHVTHYAWNLLPYRNEILQRPPVNQIRQEQMNQRDKGPTSVTHLGRDFFMHKWGVRPEKTSVNKMLEMKIEPQVPTYMFYPWFERDIETLKEQKYLWNEPYDMYAAALQ